MWDSYFILQSTIYTDTRSKNVSSADGKITLHFLPFCFQNNDEMFKKLFLGKMIQAPNETLFKAETQEILQQERTLFNK